MDQPMAKNRTETDRFIRQDSIEKMRQTNIHTNQKSRTMNSRPHTYTN